MKRLNILISDGAHQALKEYMKKKMYRNMDTAIDSILLEHSEKVDGDEHEYESYIK